MSSTITIPPIGYGALGRLQQENLLLRSVVDITSDLTRDPWQTAADLLPQMGEFVGARRAMVAEIVDDRLRSAGVWRASEVSEGTHLGEAMKELRAAAGVASGTFLIHQLGPVDPRLVGIQRLMQIRNVQALILILPQSDVDADTVVMAFEVPMLGASIKRDAAVITAFAASINAMLALKRRLREGQEVIRAVRALVEIAPEVRIDKVPGRIQSALAICQAGVGAQAVYLYRAVADDIQLVQSTPGADAPLISGRMAHWLTGTHPLPLTWRSGTSQMSAHRVRVGDDTWGALVCMQSGTAHGADVSNTADEYSRVRSLANDLLAATAGWIGGEMVRAEMMQRLEWRDADLSALVVHQQGLGEERRKAVVRELNDEVGQMLAAQMMDLGLLRDEVYERGDAVCAERLTDIIDAQHLIVTTVRQVSARLRPALLDSEGLTAAVAWYVAAFRQRVGIQVDMEIDQITPAREAPVRDAVFRILEELLTNVERHSHAEHAYVHLADLGSEILLAIEDDGVGIGPRFMGEPRLGILGIQERVKRVGGTVQFRRMGDRGTCVEARIPLTAT